MTAEFDEEELELLAVLLERRYGRATAFERAEAQLDGDFPQACAAVCWDGRGAQFVVCKTGNPTTSAGALSGATAATLSAEEYDGPTVT